MSADARSRIARVDGIVTARDWPVPGAYALPDLGGACILIVDDTLEDRAVVSSMLDLAGAGALEVGSVAEAKVTIAQLRPDAVLTEMALPDGSGADLVRWIRSYDREHQRGTVVVAITRRGGDYPWDAARAAGFDGYFTKPPATDDLVVGLSALLHARRKPR